tara:strand:- start:146 stop:421 length:276 start_codon:yes stop_codon:yes gene_type:complete
MNYNRFDINDMTVIQIFVLQDLLKAMGTKENSEGTKEECLLAGINRALAGFARDPMIFSRATAWELMYKGSVLHDIWMKHGRFWHVKITEE